MGDTFFPMISSVIQLVMRMACALLLVGVMGYRGVFFGEAAAWIGADLLLLIVFRHRIRNLEESVGGIRSG